MSKSNSLSFIYSQLIIPNHKIGRESPEMLLTFPVRSLYHGQVVTTNVCIKSENSIHLY